MRRELAYSREPLLREHMDTWERGETEGGREAEKESKRAERGEAEKIGKRRENVAGWDAALFRVLSWRWQRMSPEDKSPKQPANLLMENERIPANQEVLQERISLRWLCLGVY